MAISSLYSSADAVFAMRSEVHWKKTDALVEQLIDAFLAGTLPAETRARLIALRNLDKDPLEQLAAVYNPPSDWFRVAVLKALDQDDTTLRNSLRALVAALDQMEPPCP